MLRSECLDSLQLLRSRIHMQGTFHAKTRTNSCPDFTGTNVKSRLLAASSHLSLSKDHLTLMHKLCLLYVE